MSIRAGDWFRQAEADLVHAHHALRGKHYEWACFAAQQAEKAAKAAHPALGQEAWGYTRAEAERAIADGEAVVEVCRRVLSRA